MSMPEREATPAAAGAAGAAAVYLARPWLRFYPEGVPHDVELPDTNVAAVFAEAVRRWGERTAIVFYGRRISFRQLGEWVDRFATALHELGLRKGDRLALYLLNSPHFVVAYMAAMRLGAIVTPISPVYSAKEVRHQLVDSGARMVVCQDVLYDNVLATGVDLERIIVAELEAMVPLWQRIAGKGWLRAVYRSAATRPRGGDVLRFEDLIRRYPPRPPEVDVHPDDLAVLPYTSGTTGPPKGAMISHRNIADVARIARAFWPQLEEGKETILAFLPFYHIYGQVVVMITGLVMGNTLVVFTTPDYDEILYAMERYQASVFYGVPALYEFLREYEKTDRVDWKRLKLVLCGADTLHQATLEGWERKTGAPIYEGYGLTETTSASHANPRGRRKVGSFGVPLPNTVAAVVDPDSLEFLPPGEVGEIVISGPGVFQGYWNQPEATRQALVELAGRVWLRTGDLGRMDDEGYFYFYDRKRDLIKYKGYSVFAREIEEVLREHPQVKEAGVIGVPDPKVGQIIKAYVVLHPEARGKVSEEEILAYCRQHLAPYKVPKIVEFRGELPRTDVGKVSRRELREEVMEEL